MDTKICSKCSSEKGFSEYYIEKRTKKPSSWCKECVKKNNREHRRRKKEKKLEEERLKMEGVLEIGEKVCTICGIIKPDLIENFRPDRAGCTDCERKHGKYYRRGDTGKSKAKKWVEDNSERMTELQADWYQDNKPKIYKKYKKRYYEEADFKVKVLTKSRIHKALSKYKKDGVSKSKNTIKYLGCSCKHFVEWLEFCFEDDTFTMDNHGTIWHLDHVVPLATFDLKETSTHDIAFNWRNVMPLSGEENMAKKDKIDVSQIEKHYDNLIKFHTLKDIELPTQFTKLYAKHLTMIRESP